MHYFDRISFFNGISGETKGIPNKQMSNKNMDKYDLVLYHLDNGNKITLKSWGNKHIYVDNDYLMLSNDDNVSVLIPEYNSRSKEQIINRLNKYDKNKYEWILLDEDDIEYESEEDDMNLTFTEKAKNGLSNAATRTKDDLKDAAWRKATKASISSLRKAILKLLSKNLDNTHISLVKGFLQTSEGEAVLAVLIGTVIPYLPNIEENKKLSRLGDELRVYGFEGLMDTVFSSFVNPAMKILGDSLKNISLPDV